MSITSIVVAAAAAMCTAGFAESVAPLIGPPSKKVPVLSVKKMTKTPRLGAEAREGSELILSENFDKISNNSGKLIDCPYYPRDRYDEIVEQAYQEWLADGHDPEEEKFEGPEYNPTKDLSDLYRTGRATVSDDYMQTSGYRFLPLGRRRVHGNIHARQRRVSCHSLQPQSSWSGESVVQGTFSSGIL